MNGKQSTQVIIALKVIEMKTKYDTELLTSKERQSTLVCENKKQLQRISVVEKELEDLRNSHIKALAKLELENRAQIQEREDKLKILSSEHDTLLQQLNELRESKNSEISTQTESNSGEVKQEDIKEPSLERTRPKSTSQHYATVNPKNTQSNSLPANFAIHQPSTRLMKKLEAIQCEAKSVLQDI